MKCFGRERFGEERIGSKRQTSDAIPFGRLSRDENRAHVSISLVVSHETDDFESVDVGHVDVRDDEVEVSARKKPQCVETTRRLDDLDVLRSSVKQLGRTFEGRANERPERGGVLDDQDASHGAAAYRKHLASCTFSTRK